MSKVKPTDITIKIGYVEFNADVISIHQCLWCLSADAASRWVDLVSCKAWLLCKLFQYIGK